MTTAVLPVQTDTDRALVEELTALVRLRDQVQRLRIAESNRCDALNRRGFSETDAAGMHDTFREHLASLEKEVEKAICTEVHTHPTWPWAKRVRGIGEVSLAAVIAEIDITIPDSISALWRYCGYGVTDGERDRLRKGERAPYNKRVKTMVYRLISNQIRLAGPYDKFYRNAKHTYTTTKPEWTLKHIDLAARRKAAKLFLSHLWQIWREAEGLPVREPFIHGKGEHTIVGPWEVVTPEPNGRK